MNIERNGQRILHKTEVGKKTEVDFGTYLELGQTAEWKNAMKITHVAFRISQITQCD